MDSSREIKIERIIDTKREIVFSACTNLNVLPKWWGPKGFTITTQEINVTENGIWKFVMHGPDGIDYQNKIIFKEIKSPELIVFVHGEENSDDNFTMKITFEEINDQTKVTMTMCFATKENKEKAVKEYGAVKGANQTLDRLEGVLKIDKINNART